MIWVMHYLNSIYICNLSLAHKFIKMKSQKISCMSTRCSQRQVARPACLGQTPHTTAHTTQPAVTAIGQKLYYKQAMDVQHIIHSEKCLDTTTPKRELCKPCYSNYRKERRRLQKLESTGAIVPTQRVIVHQGSKYRHLLCEQCKEKPLKHCCEDCRKKYQSARHQVCNDNKKNNLDVNKAISSTGLAHQG